MVCATGDRIPWEGGAMSLIDKVLMVGRMVDWITPTLGFARTLAEGGGYVFYATGTGEYSPRQVAKMLQAQGIDTWGMMILLGDTLTFTVRPGDAGRASTMLQGWGVDLKNPVKAPARQARGRARRPGGLLDRWGF